MTDHAAIPILPAPEAAPRAVIKALALLRAGCVVAIPTDTVYGLAADPLSAAAVATMFRIKGRPEDQPLILMADSLEQFEPYILPLDPRAAALALHHWPGGLTLVVRRSGAEQYAVTHGDTIGIRVPDHSLPRALAAGLGRPLATTSANPSGEPPGRDAPDVARRLYGTELALVLDAGPARLGEPSTVLDVCSWPPRVLRQGAVKLAYD